MNRNYFFVIALLAVCSAILIFRSMWKEAHPPHQQETVEVSHPASPFKSYIAGVGIVEASSENIFIGTPLHRIVEKVLVTVGSEVKKGDILLKLENRDLEADLLSRQVAYEIALAKVQKLEAMPRNEDILIADAALQSAEVELSQAKAQYEIVQGLQASGALSKEEINRRRYNYERAEAKRLQLAADLNKIKAGTWKPDLQIAKLEALQAKADVERVKIDIERTIIRSPLDGNVLQIKIHEGEFPPTDTLRTPVMIIGNTDEKHLVVSINQFNTPYFDPDASAVAFLQGDGRVEFPLQFVQLDPYLVNKQNLTNDIAEKVDTRVLQITYSFKGNDKKIYVGQQMDVFIEDKHTH